MFNNSLGLALTILILISVSGCLLSVASTGAAIRNWFIGRRFIFVGIGVIGLIGWMFLIVKIFILLLALVNNFGAIEQLYLDQLDRLFK